MKRKKTESPTQIRKMRPALTPEARENQMIAMAMDLAEKQLREGTASSQVITHFLKLGSTREKLEKEILGEKKELMSTQTEATRATKRSEEAYIKVLNAMRKYSGQEEELDYED